MIMLLKRFPAALLLIGGIVLMQTHAMDYWSQYDQTTGWLWSVVIEGAAVWLWASRNGFKNTVAFLATLLALSAPLYQLAAPVLEDQRSNAQAADNLPERQLAITAQIASLEASLATYNQNSQTRGGWAARIDSAQQQLTKARNEHRQLLAEQATAQPHSWQVWLQIGTQGLALIIIQCVIVLATRTVFAPLAPASTGNKTAAPAAGESGAGRSVISHLIRSVKHRAAPNQRLTGVA